MRPLGAIKLEKVAIKTSKVEINDFLEDGLSESVEPDFDKALWRAIANKRSDMIDTLLARGANLESAINKLIISRESDRDSHFFLRLVIKNLPNLEIANQVNVDLVEKLIKAEKAIDAESISALIQKLGDNQPNYERLLEELKPWEKYDGRIVWLIDKVEQLSSPQITQDLIEYWQQGSTYQDSLLKIIQKSIHKIPNLEALLINFSDQDALEIILNKIETEISDPEIAKHILKVATEKNHIELIELLESKLSKSLQLNYDWALIVAIFSQKSEVMNALLNRGATINQAFDELLSNPEKFRSEVYKRILENTAKTQLVEQIKPDVVERIIKGIGVDEGNYYSEVLEQICQKLGDNQPNYERLLEELKPWDKFDGRIIFLIGKVEKISSLETAESLISHLSGVFYYRNQSQILTVIEKSTNKIPNPQRFLHAISDKNVLYFILNTMDEALDDEKVVKKVLEVATQQGELGLIELLEKKSATKVDYNSSLISAIRSHKIDVINFFLDHGADPNFVGGEVRHHRSHLIEHVMSAFHNDSETQNQLINNLLDRGSDPSLAINENYRRVIIGFLQQQQNYPQLEKFLPKFSNELLEEAFRYDDQKIMLMLIERDPYIITDAKLLTDACEQHRGNIIQLLAGLHAEAGDYPVVAEMALRHNNAALKALCDNGYDYNKTLPDDRFQNRHPLVIAA